MYNLAVYYELIEKNYDKMKEYYLMAIDKDDLEAMCRLCLYYNNIEKKYEEYTKYILMAIEKGNSDARIKTKEIKTILEPYIFYRLYNKSYNSLIH